MDKAFAVEILEAAQHLGDVDDAELLGEGAKALESLVERAAADELHDEEDVLVRLIHLQILDDVFVVQRRQQVCLQHDGVDG